jgi:hypothetical protein
MREKPSITAYSVTLNNRPNGLEVEGMVISASWIEQRPTGWALTGTFQVLPYTQYRSAGSAQYCQLIPFTARPDLDRMIG